MNKVAQLALQEKFPEILQRLGGDEMKTCMSWGHGGIAIGDGWYDILDMAMSLIQSHINHVQNGIDRDYPYAKGWVPVPQVIFEQVKEKFGELRVYYDGGDDYCAGVMAMATGMSTRICEGCGKPGKMRGGGWIRCSCDECEEETT